MYDIDCLPVLIELGNLNELGVCEIEFDVTAWLELYPLGVLNVTYMRPGETDVYPADVTGVSIAVPTSGNLALTLADDVYILTWTVSDAVTAIAGDGSVVVEIKDVGKNKYSKKTPTYTAQGHAAAGTPPEPLASYIQKWGAVDATIESLDTTLDPTIEIEQDENGTHFSFGIPVTVNQLMRDIEGTTQTVTNNPDGTVSQIVHTNTSTSAVIRTDVFTYDGNTVTQVRTLASGPSLTIMSNLVTLEQTIGNIVV